MGFKIWVFAELQCTMLRQELVVDGNNRQVSGVEEYVENSFKTFDICFYIYLIFLIV